jgi:hypothetical protein
MRLFKMTGLFLGMILLVGCATTGTTSLQTFNDVYRAALTADDLVVQAATNALNSGLITSTQAAGIQQVTINAKNLLTTAQVAFAAGNQVAANQDAATASATLIAMSLCLTQKPLTIMTFTACENNVPALGVAK